MTPGRTRGPQRIALVAAFASLALACAAPVASASFHLMKIRQIHPSNGMFGGEWVELQMYEPGQNFVAGKVIRTFNSTGTENSIYTIPGNAPKGDNQRTILISNLFTPAGVAADFVAPGGQLEMTGQDGAVCYANNDPPTYTPIDCVSYGNFMASIPSAGTPAVATPFESTLERTITRGCKTALDPADDTDNSAADFALSTNPPRNNATTPTEKVCPGGTGTGTGSPNTKIKKRPKNKSGDDSPTFKFKSSESGSTFKCKLDRKKFKKCKSPKTYHGLDPGKHTFKVEAIDSSGLVDKSPAKDKFKILS
jgi:hypothetical protein